MKQYLFFLLPVIAYCQSYDNVRKQMAPSSPDYLFTWKLLEQNSIETVHSHIVQIDNGKVDLHEVKAYVATKSIFVTHSSGLLSNYDPIDHIIKSPEKIKCRHYRPDGVYRVECGDDSNREYTRVFSDVIDNAEIFIQAVAYDKSSYLSSLRNLFIVRAAAYEEQADYLTAAKYKDAAQTMLNSFKQIPFDKSSRMELMGYNIDLSLNGLGLISSLSIASEERGIMNEVNNEYNTLSDYPRYDAWDPLENLESRRQQGGELGLELEESPNGQIYLRPSEPWSNYLYGSEIFNFLNEAQLLAINGKSIDVQRSLDFTTNKSSTQFTFKNGDTTIIRKFNRISAREAEVLNILKSIEFPSNLLFE